MANSNQGNPEQINLKIAQELKQAGKISEAIECYHKLLDLDNQNIQAWRQLAELYESEKNWDKALESYQKIERIDINLIWIYQKIGNLYIYRLNKPKDAIVYYRKALAKEPKSFWLNKNLAEALLADGRPKQALEAGEKALELDKNNSDIYVVLGDSYVKLEKYELALENYNKAKDLKPENTKKIDKAIAQCQELSQGKQKKPTPQKQETEVKKTEVKPKPKKDNLFQVYENQGDAFKEEGKLEEAIANYLKAQELAPERAKIYLKLGNIFKQQENFKAAISNYQKALELNNKDSWLYEILGDLLKEQGELDAAAFNYNKAVELEAKKPLLYFKLGNIFKTVGKLKQAVNNFEKAVELGLKDKFIYENLADSLRDTGNLDGAIKYYLLLLEIDQNKPWNYVKLAEVYQQKQNYKEAIKQYEKALSLKPQKKDTIEKAMALCQQALQKSPQTVKPQTSQKIGKTLSIAIATHSYNQGQFLEASLASIQSQNYTSLEYLIIDRGSTDNSIDVIKKSGNKLQSEPNKGKYEALNQAFAQSEAEIMGWLKPTDMLLPGTLNLIAQIFQDLPEVDWIGSQFPLNADNHGRIVGGFFIPGFNRLDFQNSDNLILERIFATNIQQGCSFWRRSLWEKAGGNFDAKFKQAADFELWCRFFRHTELLAINAPIIVQRENLNLLEDETYWQEIQDICEMYGMSIPNKSMITEKEILLSHTPTREVKYIDYNPNKQRFEIHYL